MFLLLVFVLLLAVFGVLFYVGALFFQSYIYTEPAPGLAWRAPAAAGAMTVFFTLWCFLVTRSDASPGNIPYDTIFRFSPKVDMFPEPAAKLWSVKGDGTKIAYKGYTDDDLKFKYSDDKKKPYSPSGVVAIELEHQGTKIRFEKGPSEGVYRLFRSPDGWVMQEYDNGPTGIPSQSRWGRFLANIGLNVLHAGLWFVCFWLLLQFRFNDSLGFAFVLTLVATVVLLPMLLDQAAIVARDRIASGSG